MHDVVARDGAEAEAKSLLQELKVAGIAPDARTLSLLLSHLVKLKQLPSALEVFNAFLAAGGAPDLRALFAPLFEDDDSPLAVKGLGKKLEIGILDLRLVLNQRLRLPGLRLVSLA